MLMQKHCFKNGVSYAPWFQAGKDLEGAKPLIVTDVMDCQRRCAEKIVDERPCQKFQYNVFTNVCHLMSSWPSGQQVSADYLISGPPKCPGHIALNITIENVDFGKLNRTPDLKHLFFEAIKDATLRDPKGYNESEYLEPLLHVENVSYRTRFYEFCTDEVKDQRNESIPENASVSVTVGIYASKGINWATAKLRTTHRCQIGTRVTDRLEELKSTLAPVMHPDSDIYVSAVSPIMAYGHSNVRNQQEGAITKVLQGSWNKVGGGRPLVATSCLLVALALCISVSAASWRRRDRPRRRLAVVAEYDRFWQMPASCTYHQPLQYLRQTHHPQALGQHDVLHFEAQSSE